MEPTTPEEPKPKQPKIPPSPRYEELYRKEFLQYHGADSLRNREAYTEWLEGEKPTPEQLIAGLMENVCEWLQEIAVQLAYRNEQL